MVGHPNNPACGAVLGDSPLQPPTFLDTSASAECLELDFDFGAFPNRYQHQGRTTVSVLQKSGVATVAVGEGRIHVGATPDLLLALDQRSGGVEWASTSDLDLFAYQPVTLANGVVYGINDSGVLFGIDAASGARLLTRQLSADGGFVQCLGVGAGVAVAHNTVFAPCDAGGPNDLAGLPGSPGGLVAYR